MRLDSKIEIATDPYDEIEITTYQGMLIRIKEFPPDTDGPHTIAVDIRPRGLLAKNMRLKSEILQDGHLAYSGVFGMSDKDDT